MRRLALLTIVVLVSLLAAAATSSSGARQRVSPRRAPERVSAPRVAQRISITRVWSGHGLTVPVPTGWHVLRGPVSAVLDPSPRLAMATFSVKLSPHPCECDTPNIENLPRRGAFLVVWEYLEVTRRGLMRTPPRPSSFSVSGTSGRRFPCGGPSWTTGFRDAGRIFQVDVYLGPAAGATVASRVDAILDGLRAARAT